MSDSRTPNPIGGVAIIGMSGRFPGAKNLDDFWQNLRDGVESISFFTNQELEAIGVDPALLSRPNYVKARAVLKDVDLFDAAFFGFNPKEAEILDPQHRLFLECAWEALENAGYDPETYPGLIGVFASGSPSVYYLFNLYPNRELREFMSNFQLTIANDREFLPTRVSYKLNLKGPSVNCQTACSSSLVGVHLACQSLLNYECDMALAGGVSIRPMQSGYLYQEGGILSPDGHCRAFDAKAQGTIFGSGLGIVVLKRLEDALAEGDDIHAVIKGSAINNDGAAKIGYTAPSVDGQTKVIAEALANAGVDPETISFIEAHGTGTALGDPIEIAALKNVFCASTQKQGFCAIGTVKTNVGHLDAAAGITGLIKTVLALKHKLLPPSLHFERPNPQIDFESSPFYVNAQLGQWRTNGTHRRAGVSSFGIGGTNAHVVLEEAPPRNASGESRPWQLLVLSAKTSTALETATGNLVDYLKRNAEANLADIAYTLKVGRGAFSHRRMLVCRGLDDVVTALETLDPKRVFTAFHEPRWRPVAFMFSGQGAQYVNMGLELYAVEDEFREPVDLCSELLKPHLGFDLRRVLYPSQELAHEAAQKLSQTLVTQPALFVIEYALARLWMAWGVRPEAMIGHSIGEYVAACLAGVLSLEDALALVAARGRLMQDLPGGAMLTVPLSENEVQPLLGKKLSLAAINGPSLCVVSGPREAVNTLEQELAEQGIASRRLHTSHAFHSEMMEPILAAFTKLVKRIRLKPPQLPYISNVTGTWITDATATDPSYWARHLRQAVRFADGVRELVKVPDRILLEIGPGRTLSTLARQHPDKTAGQVVVSSLRHPQDEHSDQEFLLDAVGQLWLAGGPVDWSGFYAREKRHRFPLPTYPFERQRYWIEQQKQVADAPTFHGSLGKKSNIAEWFYLPSWTRSTPLGLLENVGREDEESCWLIFSDSCGIAFQLERRLELANREVIRVMIGEQFSKINDHAYMLNPRRRDDYDSLLTDLRSLNRIPTQIVHLWSVTPTDQVRSGIETSAKIQDLGFYSLLFLAQAVGRQTITESLHVAVVSNDMQVVTGDEEIWPEKATVLGPCKAIPREYPNLTCSSIDIVLPESPAQSKQLIDQLIAEFSGKPADSIVAYRGKHRWVQTYKSVRLNRAAEHDLRLREGGVYLITGGLGGIGLVFAGFLAQTARAKLVLVGRSPFPDRDEWEQYLAMHDEQDELSVKIRKLRSLEESGAEVLVLNANVADEQQMQQVIKQTDLRFGKIHGVIHAAGVPGGGLIQLKTPDMVEAVYSPKLRGTLVLDSLLKGEGLDFFVLCSSLTSILGAVGQVDYCAANAFLDAFAPYKTRRDGTFTVSINWDAWAEVGMAVKAADVFEPLLTRKVVQQPSDYQEADHPLFDRYYLEADQETYSTEMSATKHWVLDEHRIMGKPTLVGTAYLELARAAFQRHATGGTMAIEDVFFVAPLMVTDGGTKEVQTILRKSGNAYEFRVRSSSGSASQGEITWQDHAMGRVAFVDSTPPKKHDIHEMMKRCSQEIIIAAQEKPLESHSDRLVSHGPMSFGPRWRNLKKVYIGENEGVAVLELPEEFCADLEKYQLHPALMDLATSFALVKLRGEGFYLPFSYKRLKIKGPMSGRIYSLARYQGDGSADHKEVLKLDIVITNEDGVELVEVEEFTMKRVSDKAVQALAGKESRHEERQGAAIDGHEQKGAAVGGLKDAILPPEGVEVFRRIILREMLSQIIVSAQDLHVRVERARTSTSSNIVEQLEKKNQVVQPVHPRPNVRTEYVAAGNDLERTIAEIWQMVLGIEQVGIHDDFIELGGHSLLAIQVISKMREAFPVSLPVDVIYRAPTVAQLAEAVLQALTEEADSDMLAEMLAEIEQFSDDGPQALSTPKGP
jgi:acyl transferase domain-containing protein/acyl carrier protein